MWVAILCQKGLLDFNASLNLFFNIYGHKIKFYFTHKILTERKKRKKSLCSELRVWSLTWNMGHIVRFRVTSVMLYNLYTMWESATLQSLMMESGTLLVSIEMMWSSTCIWSTPYGTEIRQVTHTISNSVPFLQYPVSCTITDPD